VGLQISSCSFFFNLKTVSDVSPLYNILHYWTSILSRLWFFTFSLWLFYLSSTAIDLWLGSFPPCLPSSIKGESGYIFLLIPNPDNTYLFLNQNSFYFGAMRILVTVLFLLTFSPFSSPFFLLPLLHYKNSYFCVPAPRSWCWGQRSC